MKKLTVVLVVAVLFGFTNLQAHNKSESSTSIETIKKNKISPLCLAIAKGDMEGFNKLLELGADLDRKSNGMLPVHYAARYNRVAMMQSLIKAGADTNRTCDKGYSVKKHAALSNADDILSLMESNSSK
jgi:ankyrin repeat protein